VYLNLDRKRATLIVEKDFRESSITSLSIKPFVLTTEIGDLNTKFSNIEFESELTHSEYQNRLNTLNLDSKVIKANPNFTNFEGQLLGLSDYFYVKLKSTSDYALLEAKATENNIIVVKQNEFMPLWYTLKVTKNTKSNSLEIANQFFETGLFDSCQPDFLSDDTFCSDDPMFGSLWGLSNSNNPGIDINVCDAWEITEGQGVNVAVLDQGIFKTHIDLSSNIHPISYNSETNTSPSQMFGSHGTHVAGTIGAIKDNDIQVVGVAPSSKLIDVSNSLNSIPNSRMKRSDGINWAWQNGADIINNSWGSSVQYDIIDDAISEALQNGRNGLGCVVVFSTGNSSESVGYPANSNPDIIAVGSITSNGNRSNFSNYGSQLDVVAPGSNILSTIPNNETKIENGTSMAAPHVSGVAALILSVNPCLTGKQVRDIIEQTAQKVGNYSYTNNSNRPNGTWNNQMGYGLVNAYATVQMAQQTEAEENIVDLYIKDSSEDLGIEPNTISEFSWTSPDIWVRNQEDGIEEHQNPEYHPTNPNYIYVRVNNRGCGTSEGTEKLNLYWAKASPSLSWYYSWNEENTFPNGQPVGGKIGTVTIPAIASNESVVVSIPWENIPNPSDYDDINQTMNKMYWHFCLLAQIEAKNDPITDTEPISQSAYVRNNNNVAQKNITIIGLPNSEGKTIISGAISVGTIYDFPACYSLEFVADKSEVGKKLIEEAEISIELDSKLQTIWEKGGSQKQNITSHKDNKFIVRGDNAVLKNLCFQDRKDIGMLNLKFNFLTQEVSEKQEYTFHVIQKDENDEIIGGETYQITRPQRNLFFAVANDQTADKNEMVTISAETINEPAVYNWYDTDGNLIHEGIDFETSVTFSEKYKLEIIALSDGYKDYAEAKIELKPNRIELFYPNPASGEAHVKYIVNQGENAYLSIIPIYTDVVNVANTVSDNYILDVNNNTKIVNLNNYSVGLYKIILVVDGQISDTQTLLKN